MRLNGIRQKLPLRPVDLFFRLERIFSDFLFPPKCLVCSLFFQPPEDVNARGVSFGRLWNVANGKSVTGMNISRFLAPFLCPDCMSRLTPIEAPICTCCGISFQTRQESDHLCGDCIISVKNFSSARAPFVYDQIMMDVIHSFKYKGKTQLAGVLGQALLAVCMRSWDCHQFDFIIPVPLHNKKLRQRGFNQSYLLIKNWKKLLSLSNVAMPAAGIAKDALKRIRPTVPQTGLGRSDRLANIKGAFAVNSKKSIENKRVLLVDDVYTTGATVNECARVLLGAGARSVDILTLARAH